MPRAVETDPSSADPLRALGPLRTLHALDSLDPLDLFRTLGALDLFGTLAMRDLLKFRIAAPRARRGIRFSRVHHLAELEALGLRDLAPAHARGSQLQD